MKGKINIGIYAIYKIGDVVNNWTIVSDCFKNKFGKDTYLCQCVCGKHGNVEAANLVNGKSKSCGCTRLVPSEEQRRRRKQYKHNYFQENKQKIYDRVLPKQEKKRKENYEKYGTDPYFIKSHYGITPEIYLDMINNCNNKCQICGTELNIKSREYKPCIDHDHNSGKVRGILCRKCNAALGLFNDDISRIYSAEKYLLGGQDEKTCNDQKNN